MSVGAPPRTIFLDAGVIIDGCLSYWSISKALLILAAQYPHHYTILLADAIDAEVQTAMQRKAQPLRGRARAELLATYPTWLNLATVTHLRIVHPTAFLEHLSATRP